MEALWATILFSGFALEVIIRHGKDFVKAGKKLIANDFRTNGEFYICPCYNELIKEKKKIGVFNIGKEGNGMYGLGIPSDLKYFLSLDISKKLRG